MILVDANLLLYAEDSQAARHAGARDWWDAQLSGDDPVCLCCGGPLLPDCGEDSHRNSRGVIGFELVGRPVSERLVDSL